MGIHDTIERIKQRPVLYLGGESITALWYFVLGYTYAELDYRIDEIKKSILPLGFGLMHEYADFRLGVSNAKGWCQNILEVCNGDEKAALHKFFEYYDDFCKTEIRHCEKAVMTEENIRYCNSMKHGYSVKNGKKEPLFREPKAVFIAELSFGGAILAVDTADGIVQIREIFNGDNMRERMIGYAENTFGKIDRWEADLTFLNNEQ